MDLTCAEDMLPPDSGSPDSDKTLKFENSDNDPGVEPVTSKADPVLLNDPRVLPNMLKAEEINMSNCNYFKVLQRDITPDMRRAVTSWMFEVCEENECPENVFLCAVNYMDRYLTIEKITRNQFQLLGAVCLMISSKWCGSCISASRLSVYTDRSCEIQTILDWELMVLGRLRWDTFFVTPSDFVDHLLPKLDSEIVGDEKSIKDKTKTYAAYCATDEKFSVHPPSMIAAASITSAVGNALSQSTLQRLIESLHELTSIETDVLKSCVEQLRMKITEMMTENSNVPGPVDPGYSHHNHHGRTEISDKLIDIDQAETPTDVREINF